MPNQLIFAPCLDSEEMATARRLELDIERDVAAELGQSAVAAARAGTYLNPSGQPVNIAPDVRAACLAQRSIPTDAPLPAREWILFPETTIQVSNETTLGASRRLVDRGMRPLALNFANGVTPGGGFLSGSRAQEEVLCRSSALYQTLEDDPMYAAHQKRNDYESSDWVILSPRVPVFRTDSGVALGAPWNLDFITCAAPVATRVGQERAANLLQKRILRVLAIARAFGYETLVLGAWGCGAFGNDPARTATDFRAALETEFSGAFSCIVFAVTDWSPERKFLGPFRDVFTQ